MNRRERLEQIRKSRGWHPAPDGVGCMACSLVNALAEAEKVIEAAREIADTGTWRLGSDERDNIMRHGFESVDLARAALAAYDTFMERSEG